MKTFDEWFSSKQGEAYDSMYCFARDAWKAAQGVERDECCSIIFGQCGSDNVAQRTVDAIRARGEK